jgi:hypothetical protein
VRKSGLLCKPASGGKSRALLVKLDKKIAVEKAKVWEMPLVNPDWTVMALDKFLSHPDVFLFEDC